MYALITKGKYQHIEISNDFDFFIYDEGKKYPIERFSGGEVDLANLVLRIAISKTLAEVSGTSSVGFLAFDEVFGSEDEARRLEILEAFHTIKEQYRQINCGGMSILIHRFLKSCDITSIIIIGDMMFNKELEYKTTYEYLYNELIGLKSKNVNYHVWVLVENGMIIDSTLKLKEKLRIDFLEKKTDGEVTYKLMNQKSSDNIEYIPFLIGENFLNKTNPNPYL